jgi:hypothetical protein
MNKRSPGSRCVVLCATLLAACAGADPRPAAADLAFVARPGHALVVVLRPSADVLGESTHVYARVDRHLRPAGRLRGADFLDIPLPAGEGRICAHQGSDQPRFSCISVQLEAAEVHYLEWAVAGGPAGPGSVRDGAAPIGGQGVSSGWGRLGEAQARTLLRGLARGTVDAKWR